MWSINGVKYADAKLNEVKIMKNKKLAAIATFILLSQWSLASYATSHNMMNMQTSSKSHAGYSIHSIDSGRAALSLVKSTKRKGGYMVTGNVRIKTMQRRLLRLPGKVTIELKNAKGDVLETVTAKFHQKFGASKAAHFDGMIKMSPPRGSIIVVTHSNAK